MKKSITKNYIYNLIYQIFLMLMPLITTPYLARTLKVEAIGIYSYITTISAYCIMFGTIGLNWYGEREIAFCFNDKYKRSKTFIEILLLRFITLSLCLIIYYFLFIRSGEYSFYFKLLSLEIIGSMIDISFFYRGIEEIKKIIICNFIVKIISVLGIFLLIKSPNDIYKYILIYCFKNIICNILLLFNIKKYIMEISFKTLNIIRHLKKSLKIFIPQLSVGLYFFIDKMMLGLILHDMVELGYYEQASKIINVFLVLIISLNTVLSPRIAKLYSIKDYLKIKEYLNKSFSFIFFLFFPIVFGLLSISRNFVFIYFGAEYLPVINLINIMSFIIICNAISNITGTNYLLPTKKEKKYTISIIVGLLINLVLNIMLIFKYKSIGVAISSFVSELTIALVQLYFVRKELDILKILKSSKNYLISSFVMFLTCFIIGKFISNNYCIIIQILLGIIVYFTMLFILKDKFIYEIKERLIYKKMEKI